MRNNSRIAKGMRRHVMERDGGWCRYCGGPAQTIDHVMPRVQGGLNVASNLVASCFDCNNEKGDLLLSESGLTLREPSWWIERGPFPHGTPEGARGAGLWPCVCRACLAVKPRISTVIEIPHGTIEAAQVCGCAACKEAMCKHSPE